LDVLIEVRTQYNRKNVLIVLDENIDLDNEFFPVKGFYLDSLKKRHKPEYKKIPEEPEDPNVPKDFKLHSQADQVIKFTDQMRSSSQSVLDALRGRVPGLSIGNGGSSIRGGSSIFGSNDPLYLIDGMPTNYQGIQSININDVDYVEILKGPSSAIYGLRGANGVIAVYTKKGHFYKRGEIRFKMLGYHTPKKFYTPKFEINDEEENQQNTFDPRKTIFWSPKVKTDEQGRTRIQFKHSDIPGDFVITAEGIDIMGRPGKIVYNYSVK
jgi:TonB-dependent SusC/RagA subfamily outer membrane receptor